jgi:hypothetical protein
METNTEIEKTELAKLEVHNVNLFSTKELFEHVQRVAAMFSKSDMVPKRYQGNLGNCIIALEMANRMGASPIMVMQNLDVILGKPSWSSTFLIASLNASGKFSPLRYEEDSQNGGRTRAWAYDKSNGERCNGAWVSMEMAKAEGWIDKPGSKWKTMPELMRRYRAGSFFTKQFAPEVSMGLQSTEEIQDISYTEVPKPDKELERKKALILDCKTMEDLELLQNANPDWDSTLFEEKLTQLKK